MADFILLMHGDSTSHDSASDWGPYLDGLQRAGALRGGSAIGGGACLRKSGQAADLSRHLAGYVKIEARDLDHARELVRGNPVYEAGGTVEIRELPVSASPPRRHQELRSRHPTSS